MEAEMLIEKLGIQKYCDILLYKECQIPIIKEIARAELQSIRQQNLMDEVSEEVDSKWEMVEGCKKYSKLIEALNIELINKSIAKRRLEKFRKGGVRGIKAENSDYIYTTKTEKVLKGSLILGSESEQGNAGEDIRESGEEKKRQRKYIINTNRNKIITDESEVAFGYCAENFEKLVFKTIRTNQSSKRELMVYERIKKESKISMSHLVDYFVREKGSGDKAGEERTVLVMKKLEPFTTHDRDLVDISKVMYTLLKRVGQLHEVGIVHMDINPSNLMVHPSNRCDVQVIDFGLVYDLRGNETHPMRGTCGFVAPEVASGQEHIDGKADIYSLGVVFGMLLNNHVPGADLRYLGGPYVTCETTAMIVEQLELVLSSFGYEPSALHTMTDSDQESSRHNIQSKRLSCTTLSDEFDMLDREIQLTTPTSVCMDMQTTPFSQKNPESLFKWCGFPITFDEKKKPKYKDSKVPLTVLHSVDLLRALLQPDPTLRPTCHQILSYHPFFSCFDYSYPPLSENGHSSLLDDFDQTNISVLNRFALTDLDSISIWSHEISSLFCNPSDPNKHSVSFRQDISRDTNDDYSNQYSSFYAPDAININYYMDSSPSSSSHSSGQNPSTSLDTPQYDPYSYSHSYNSMYLNDSLEFSQNDSRQPSAYSPDTTPYSTIIADNINYDCNTDINTNAHMINDDDNDDDNKFNVGEPDGYDSTSNSFDNLQTRGTDDLDYYRCENNFWSYYN